MEVLSNVSSLTPNVTALDNVSVLTSNVIALGNVSALTSNVTALDSVSVLTSSVTALNNVSVLTPNVTVLTNVSAPPANVTALDNVSVLTSNVTALDNVTTATACADVIIYTLTILKVSYYALAAVVAMIGNGLVMATVFRRHGLHRVSYYLVANLAFKDFTFALVSSVLALPSIVEGCWIFGHHMCIVFGFVTTWLSFIELLVLVGLAMDRYLACIRPLRYHEIVTPRKFEVACALAWFYSALWAAMPLVGFAQYVYYDNIYFCQLDWSRGLVQQIYINSLGACLFFPGTFVIIYCYVKIFRSVRKVITPPAPVFTLQTVAIGQVKGERQRAPRSSSGRTKATLTISLITGVYFFCWIPFVGVRLSQHYVHDYKENSILPVVEEVTVYSFTVANFINPVIYGVYNREFRHELRRLLKT